MQTRPLLALVAATPLAAQDGAPAIDDRGRAIAETFAAQADADGVISENEIGAVGASAFASLDADGDGAVGLDEMLSWRFGMAGIAAFRDRTQAFDAIVGMVFDVFDAADDGRLTQAGHRAAVTRAASLADRDGNGTMTHDEPLGGSIFNTAMRYALIDRPAPPDADRE